MRDSGRTLIEYILIGVVVLTVILVLMLALPRQRETARATACQKNLAHIGMSLALYQQAVGRLPTAPPLTETAPSVLGLIFQELKVTDLTEVRDPKTAPKPTLPPAPGSRVVGLICPSDPIAAYGTFRAAVSYRANVGDTDDALHGPFEPGKVLGFQLVDDGDGLSFTAAFSERLVGTGTAEDSLRNYSQPAGGPIKGDAGDDWSVHGWRTTIYQHGVVPNAPESSISPDGKAGRMGASSGHVNKIHALLMDGSVRPFTTNVDPGIWRSFGTTHSQERQAK